MRGARLGRIDALVIALCAAGCFSDRGVAIEVDVGTTGATSVELYLGKDPCDSDHHPPGVTCDSITPPDATSPLTGNMFFRDASVRYTVNVDVKDHTATFRLQADQATRLPIAIAVGFVRDEQGTQGMRPVGAATMRPLEIPLNSARIVTTTLIPANQVQPSGDGETRVIVWNKPTSPSSCVAVEHSPREQPATWDFVVPLDDPDCDGLLNKDECNANAFDGMNAGGQAATPNCFTAGESSCVLGSLACADGHPPVLGTCQAQQDQAPVCVPSQFCTICPDTIGSCSPAKINEKLASIPHIDCYVPSLPDIGLCSTEQSIDLSDRYQSGNCGDSPRLEAFPPGDPTEKHNFDGVEMDLSSASAPCEFKVIWKGGLRTVADPIDLGVIRLSTSRGAVLLPIALHFMTGSCLTTPFTCTLTELPTDPLWTCAP